jgi:hypothetical protein
MHGRKAGLDVELDRRKLGQSDRSTNNISREYASCRSVVDDKVEAIIYGEGEERRVETGTGEVVVRRKTT